MSRFQDLTDVRVVRRVVSLASEGYMVHGTPCAGTFGGTSAD